MKEYRIKIFGGIDFVVLSPQALSSFISKIHASPQREIFIKIEDIMPWDFIEYVLKVINSNRFENEHFRYSYIINDPITKQELYQIMKKQLIHMKIRQGPCLHSITLTDTLTGEAGFDIACSEPFFWACKDSSARFIYTDTDGEQEVLIIEY